MRAGFRVLDSGSGLQRIRSGFQVSEDRVQRLWGLRERAGEREGDLKRERGGQREGEGGGGGEREIKSGERAGEGEKR